MFTSIYKFITFYPEFWGKENKGNVNQFNVNHFGNGIASPERAASSICIPSGVLNKFLAQSRNQYKLIA